MLRPPGRPFGSEDSPAGPGTGLSLLFSPSRGPEGWSEGPQVTARPGGQGLDSNPGPEICFHLQKSCHLPRGSLPGGCGGSCVGPQKGQAGNRHGQITEETDSATARGFEKGPWWRGSGFCGQVTGAVSRLRPRGRAGLGVVRGACSGWTGGKGRCGSAICTGFHPGLCGGSWVPGLVRGSHWAPWGPVLIRGLGSRAGDAVPWRGRRPTPHSPGLAKFSPGEGTAHPLLRCPPAFKGPYPW